MITEHRSLLRIRYQNRIMHKKPIEEALIERKKSVEVDK